MSTPNLDLAQVPTGTLEPSIPINDALQVLDAVVQLVVESADLTDPPATVGDDAGRRWIVAASATGAWAGHDDEVALCTGADLWRYLVPKEGWVARVKDENLRYEFDGSAWGTVSIGSAPNVQSVATAATVTPTYSNDIVEVTAQNGALAIANPTGAPDNGHPILFRLKDDGTARAISFGTAYLGVGGALPSTTTAGKWMYFTGFYSAADSKVHIILPAAVQP